MALVKRTFREWQLLLQTYSEEEIVETAIQIQEEEDRNSNVLVEICKTGLMSYEAMNQMLLAYIASKDHTAITDYYEMLHQGLIRRRGVRLPHQIQKDKGRKPLISISDKEYPKPDSFTLSVEDVWGKVQGKTKINDGMIVSRTGQVCQYFQDVVPFRSVSVLCNVDQYQEVIYWLQKVHGKRCITNVRAIMDGRKLAIRSEDQK
ncbi:hypothetical protein [Paenibacillus taichungensis]